MQELAGLWKVRCAHLSPCLFSDVKLVNYSWPEYLCMKIEGPFIRHIQTHLRFGTRRYTCVTLLRKHPAEAPAMFFLASFCILLLGEGMWWVLLKQPFMLRRWKGTGALITKKNRIICWLPGPADAAGLGPILWEPLLLCVFFLLYTAASNRNWCC